MSPFFFACVVTACLVSHNRIGALADATTTAPTPSSVCQLPPYNVKDLMSNNFWYANITSPGSESPCLGANVTSCTFYFAFCQALTGLPENPTNCSGSAVCQVGKEAKGKKFAYSMGQFQANGTIFQENNGTVDGGFFMEVKNGSKNPIDTNCKDTTVGTRVILVCDSSAKWKTSNLTDFITVAYDIPKDCSYQITLRYDGACLTNDTNTTATASPATPTPTPTPSTPTPSTSTPSTSTSTSSVTNSTSSLPSTSVTNSSTPTPSTTSTPSSSSSSNATTVPTTPTSTATSHSPSTGSITTTSTSSSSRTSTSSPGPTPTTPPPHPPHTTSERPTHPPTKQPTSDPDRHKIAGLTAGVVIFALLAFFLLLLLIGAVWYFKRGNFRYRKVTDED